MAPSGPPRARVSANVGWGRAFLAFGDEDVTFERVAVLGSSDLFLGRYTLTLGAGGVPTGSLEGKRTYDLRAGFVGSAALSWRVFDEQPTLPYVVLTAAFSGMRARVELDDQVGQWLATDFRFSVTAGKSLDWVSPYLSLRVFGGPVFFSFDDETRVGGDRYHVQAALGAVFILPEGFDLFGELAPVAEQSLYAGIGYRY
ncbi:MAG TPA: hypothetical protein VL400_21975 [Polyangiaceae bacterium]|nr:hypothetical protein [Polyangiaceae bacterium]